MSVLLKNIESFKKIKYFILKIADVALVDEIDDAIFIKLFYCKKWNVTPLLGCFGGRVGICSFLKSPPLPLSLPPLSFSLIALFSFAFKRVCARLQAQGLAQRAAITVFTLLKANEKREQ